MFACRCHRLARPHMARLRRIRRQTRISTLAAGNEKRGTSTPFVRQVWRVVIVGCKHVK